jgi:RimJ/RimL family protein N-acetyltransferase
VAWVKGEAYDFAIIDRSDGVYLGGCGLNHINKFDCFANLGYFIRSSRAKRGAATAATLLLARFGFAELKLHRIEIVVAVGNVASQRVAAKVGAKQEGVLRKRLVVRDNVYDAVMFSLLPEDIK